MVKKSYAVIGLGRFGYSVAETLAKYGCEVIAVDDDADIIQSIASVVTYAMRADVTETGVLESLGISNVDVVIVGIAGNMEASIMATIYAKEAGVKYVMAKSMNRLHGSILKKVGADEVISPEWAMGKRVAKNLLSGGFMDFFELSAKFSLVEITVPPDWIGKNLEELNIRKRYGLNVIGMKMGDEVETNIDPKTPFQNGQTLIIVGENESLGVLKG